MRDGTREPPAPQPLSGRWRSSTTRLIAIYGLFFLAWSIVLVASINWQTTQYLDDVVGDILGQRMRFLSHVDRDQLPMMLATSGEFDLRGATYYGLFDANGVYMSGNIDHLPEGLPFDGVVRSLPNGVLGINGQHNSRAQAVARRLDSGEVMVLARYSGVADRVGALTRSALLWGLSLLLIPGLIGGYLLSRGPLRRVRAMDTAMQPVLRGELGTRLPVSGRRDEFDLVASIVNRMLDQIERLLGEVKGVSDSIAHDLRTPLTRLRAQLHRAQQMTPRDDPREHLIERCIVDVDALLDRFRALLRISELEDMRRRAAFGPVDLDETLQRVHELYAPLAEEKSLQFSVESKNKPTVQADAALLFEAIGNLVDNAIKFSPAESTVTVRAIADDDGPRVEVIDSGPGVPANEREAVLRRFYRSEHMSEVGNGLGLPLVAAIARLHGFCFEIGDRAGGGARMTLYCWPCDSAGARSA
ncbi:MAG TPA: HAMP domain-containing sensor histidine kinase [Rudaea sp.]|jgi:signal transduction histidine kinase|nr:HAMP domain-containing sensor histidine kinase [Rudaea sp.]